MDTHASMIKDLMSQGLSSNNNVRKDAEAKLMSMEGSPGFALSLLTLIHTTTGGQHTLHAQDAALCQSFAI